MPAARPSSRLKRMQWIAIILVTAAITLNYMDRTTLAIGNVKTREEFHIGATAIGAVITLVGAALFQFFMTTVIDEGELKKYAAAVQPARSVLSPDQP